MKRLALALVSVFAAFVIVGCDDGSDSLSDGRTNKNGTEDPNATAGGADGTYDHNNDPAAPTAEGQEPADPAQVKMVGSPEVTSRLHACGKLSYTSLGNILTSRGIGAGQGRPANAQTPQQIYQGAAASFGAPNYPGRQGEAPFASTSAMAKMFDIFTMGSYDVSNAAFTAPACPGVKVLDAGGKFTKDGLSCLMGKPARDEHLAIANDAITKNPTDGAKIAIAALLSAAHTCQ